MVKCIACEYYNPMTIFKLVEMGFMCGKYTHSEDVVVREKKGSNSSNSIKMRPVYQITNQPNACCKIQAIRFVLYAQTRGINNL